MLVELPSRFEIENGVDGGGGGGGGCAGVAAVTTMLPSSTKASGTCSDAQPTAKECRPPPPPQFNGMSSGGNRDGSSSNLSSAASSSPAVGAAAVVERERPCLAEAAADSAGINASPAPEKRRSGGGAEPSSEEILFAGGGGGGGGQSQSGRTDRPRQSMGGREYEHLKHHQRRSHSDEAVPHFRPPSLILPDPACVEHDFGGGTGGQELQPEQHPGSGRAPSHHSEDADYRPLQQSYHLPVSLVMSPHDVKPNNSLDPNAREFTPTASPCPSPTPPALVPIVHQPVPYLHAHQMEPPAAHISYAPAVELGSVVYSAEYNGVPVMPLYANGGAVYSSIPGSVSPWDVQQHHHAGMGGVHASELPPNMVSGPVTAAAMAGQQHPFSAPPATTQQQHQQQQQQQLMRPYVSAPTGNSYISSGYSTPIGSPTGGVSAFSVLPPPSTGREHVSRGLLLSGVPTELTDFVLQQELEQWGLVRALGLERRHEGLVTVHYYDLRHAKDAMREIQAQHLLQQQRMRQRFQQQQHHQHHYQHRRGGKGSSSSRQQLAGGPSSSSSSSGLAQTQNVALEIAGADGLDESHVNAQTDHATAVPNPPPARGLIGGRAVWAQYTVPVGAAAGVDSHNQGTLVVFNLDVGLPMSELQAAFEVYGAVKELRETPAKRQHKFVEFFDVRDAARALAALDGQEIGGKKVKIEFSRPGGSARRARVEAQAQALGQHARGSLVPVVGNRMSAAAPAMQPGTIQGPVYVGWGADPSLASAPPGSVPQYMWANYQQFPQVPPMAPLGAFVQQQQQQWNVGPGQLQSVPYHQQLPATPSPGFSVPGLVPIGNDSVHGRPFRIGRFSGGPSPSYPASTFQGGGASGFGRAGGSNSSSQGGGGTSGRVCNESTGRRRRGSAGNSNGSISKLDLACLPANLGDSKQGAEESRESPRSGKTSKSSPREHAQYLFHADQAEVTSESPRTTLMIRNIPNKYSQAMLLGLLDQHCVNMNTKIVDPNEPHSGYDFVYLPIDFKNRCNLGYAFVNFTSVKATIKLYKSFHAQQWEAFNSRKICQVTYARVQGRAACEEHFRNSRFACDTDEYLPLVFTPPRTGIVCPPPIVAAGHLAGRALICSPREMEAAGIRSQGNKGSGSSGDQQQQQLIEKSGVDQAQRDTGTTNASSDHDSDCSAGSGGTTATVAVTAGSSHAGRVGGSSRHHAPHSR